MVECESVGTLFTLAAITSFAVFGCGLSKLLLGWKELGIVHERVQPGRPQQSGRHERMHRTRKKDAMNLPAASLRAQHSRFDRFRHMFKQERPHEGLNNQTSASLYIPALSEQLEARHSEALTAHLNAMSRFSYLQLEQHPRNRTAETWVIQAIQYAELDDLLLRLSPVTVVDTALMPEPNASVCLARKWSPIRQAVHSDTFATRSSISSEKDRGPGCQEQRAG